MSLYRRIAKVEFEVMDLKGYFIKRLIECAEYYIGYAYNTTKYNRSPHWINRTQKILKKAEFLTIIAKPEFMQMLLERASNHFENSRSRAYNIFFPSLYIGCRKAKNGEDFENKQHYRFHYYLAMRIRKRRVKVKNSDRKMLAYVGMVDKICPMGQVIHMKVNIDRDGIINIKEFDWKNRISFGLREK